MSVVDGLVTGEHDDPRLDAWIDSVEIRELRMSTSDHDVVEISPRLAEEIMEERRGARRSQG